MNPYLRLLQENQSDRIPETTPPGMRNSYQSILDDMLRQQEQQLSASLAVATREDPDQYAVLKRTANALQMPEAALNVLGPDEAARRLRLQEITANVSDAPTLRKNYTRADFARIAADDSWDLSLTEKIIRGGGGRGVQRGILQHRLGGIGFKLANGQNLTYKERIAYPELQQLLSDVARDQEGRGPLSFVLNETSYTATQFVTGAPTALAATAVGAGAGALGGATIALVGGQAGPQAATPEEAITVPGLAAGGALLWGRRGYVAGQALYNYRTETGMAYLEYSQFRDIDGELLPTDIARGAAHLTGVLNMGLETVADITLAKAVIPGMERFLSQPAKRTVQELLATREGRNLLADLGSRIGRTATVEGFTEALQETTNILVGEGAKAVAEAQTGQVFEAADLGEAAGRVGSAALSGAVGGGGLATVTAPITIPVERYYENREIARLQAEGRTASGQIDRLERAVAAAAATKLNQRDQQALQEFIDEAAADAGGEASTVFIAPDSFAQTAQTLNMDVRSLAELLGVQDQLQDAALTSSDIQVPVGKFITTAANNEAGSALLQVAKLNPFLPSRADLQQMTEDGQQEAIARAAVLADVAQRDQQVTEGASEIEKNLASQLNAVGRFPAGQNQVYATAAAQWYATLAQRLQREDGTQPTPQEVFQRFPLRVTGERITGAPGAQAPAYASEAQVRAEAQRTGYQGVDTGESREWVAAIAKGLPMDTEARMARAQEMGFDAENVLYHGTTQDVTAFRSSVSGSMGPGVYLSRDPAFASRYAYSFEETGGNVIPVYVRGRLASAEQALELFQDIQFQLPEDATVAEIDAEVIATLKSQGFSGIEAPAIGGEKSVISVFDPADIRSVNAAFDPDAAASADLLAQETVGQEGLEGVSLEDPASLGLTPELIDRVNPIYRRSVLPTEKMPSNQEAALWLEAQFPGKPIIDFTIELTDQQIEEIASVMMAEAMLALRESGNASDWYSEAMVRALGIASIKYPMLSDDAAAAAGGFGTASNARFIFTYIMAVTSQNLDVTDNSVATDKAFEEMVARLARPGNNDFSMPASWATGDKQKSMGINFEKFEKLINTMPGETFAEQVAELDKMFRSSMTVKEWEAFAKKKRIPYTAPGQTAKDAVVYGSSVLGPKIGNGFWQNLNNNFDPLTIDLWMRRTWGRLTGKSIGNPDALPEQRARLAAAIKRSRSREQGKPDHIAAAETAIAETQNTLDNLRRSAFSTKKAFDAEERRLKAELKAGKEVLADLANLKAPEAYKAEYNRDNEALLAYAKRLLAVWNKEYKQRNDEVKKKYGKSAKVPDNVQPTWARAAKTIVNNLAKPLDQVANATQRKQIEKAAKLAIQKLADRGIDVKTADLQAILWYPEKELWGALTDELNTDEDGVPIVEPSVLNVSYDTAWTKILKDQGYEVPGIEGDGSGTGGAGGAIAGQDAGLGRPEDTTGAERMGPVAAGSAAETLGQEALAERPQQPRVIYEVAPDPNNTALTDRWRQLTPEQRLAVSKIVAGEILPNVLRDLGASGRVLDQIGSYLDDTNPSFALALETGDVDLVTKIIGFVLSQDSMMAISPDEFPGSFSTSALRIDVGEKTFEEIAGIYSTLRAITLPDGRQPIGGQTTSDGEMTILLGAEDDADALSRLVDSALDNVYEVTIHEVYAAFPEKQEYDYASSESDPPGNEGVARQRARAARSEASSVLAREIDRVPRPEPGQRVPEAGAGGPVQVDRGRLSSPRRLSDGTTEAVHYGRVAGLTETDPNQWGKGGAFLPREERNRIGEAPKRTYFGLNVGIPGGYVKEAGTGDNVYYAYIPLDRMYDQVADPDNLMDVARQIFQERGVAPRSAIELAIKEAGWAGYWAAHPALGMTAVMFEPVPVSTERRPDAIPPEETLGQDKTVPTFYSALQVAAERAKIGPQEPQPTDRASAEQWKVLLKKAPGVKQEELDVTGVLDWLDMQARPLTRADVTTYLKANGIQIVDVAKGYIATPDAQTLTDLMARISKIEMDIARKEDRRTFLARRPGSEEQIAQLTEEIDNLYAAGAVLADEIRQLQQRVPRSQMPMFENYSLPGGENYSEILLTLPGRVIDNPRIEDLTEKQKRDFIFFNDRNVDEVDMYGLSEADLDAMIYEMGLTQEDLDAFIAQGLQITAMGGYRGEHWTELNVLAHVRFKERTVGNQRLLAIEEIQSDWHQTGRVRGYKQSFAEWYATVGMDLFGEPFEQLREREQNMARSRYEVMNYVKPEAGPYSDTKAWVSLALKRMIRHAAEQGFDGITWIPGDIQNGNRLPASEDNRGTFYDSIVVSAANKIGKQYGVQVQQQENAAVDRDGRPVTMWYMEVTPELRDAALTRGFALFARERRGEYAPSLNEIRLNATADFSTFLHEMGHHFLEGYNSISLDLARRQESGEVLSAQEQDVVDDTRRLITEIARQTNTAVEGDALAWWAGLKFEERREMHEQFARLTEAYFMDGQAPIPALQRMFQTFKRWMMRVYASMRELDVELNDEVRGILDRMFAAEADIKDAEENRGLNPAFREKPAFMDEATWRSYQELARQATATAEENLTARSLRDMQWMRKARAAEIRKLQKDVAEIRAAVETQVRGEIGSQPVNRARMFLRRGTRPDGTEVQGPHKLSIPLMKELFPETRGIDWQSLGYGKYGMLAKEGLDPDTVAEMFGYSSGEAMIQDLLSAEPMDETVQAETDARMLEQYGDLASEEAMNRAADEAIHNAFRGRVLAAEYSALSSATGGRRMLSEKAQQIAQQQIGKLRASKLNPANFIAAERRAQRKAEKALAANDLAGAATAKRDQLLNFELAREAQRVLKERNRALNLFQRIVSAKKDTVSKSRNYDLVQAARAILSVYGLGRVKNAPIEYLQAVKTYDPLLYSALEPTLLAAVTAQTTLDELSVDQFLGLRDTVEQLWQLSREEKKIEVEGKKQELEAVAEQLIRQLETVGDIDRAQITQGATEAQKKLREFNGLRASMRRVESWARLLDGGKVGIFTRAIWRPISEAADRYRADRNSYVEQFRALFATIEKGMSGKKINASELSYTFANKSELLHAILHTGNASNKRKLMLGRQWGQERSDGTIDDSKWQAFVQRMAQEGVLTKADMDFVQGVWDLLDQIKPLAQETHRKVFGRYFDEITAEQMMTPFGMYRGGYVPAIYDQFFVADAGLRAQQEAIEANDSQMFPSVASGFTKSRVEYNEVLLLDLRVLPQHIDKVLKFAHMAGPVRDVLRILKRKDVARALESIDPTAQSDMLLPWLQRSARQITETPMSGQGGRATDAFFRAIRRRSGMGLMFANLVNVAQQVTGFSLAALTVNPKYLASSLVQYISNPAKLTQAINEASPMMRDRMSNQLSALFGEIDKIIDKNDRYGQAVQWFGRHTYFMQQAVQNVVDVIVWQGAYNQALARGETEAEASKQGDAAVRQTQGTTFPEDVSRIETGPAVLRSFTHMYTYFNMWGNLLSTEMRLAVREAGLRKGAGRLLYVYFAGYAAPALLAQLIADALRGALPEDEDDDGWLDEWLGWFFNVQAKTALAFVPVAGQAGVATIGAFTEVPYDDRVGGSPAISTIEAAVRTPASVYKAVAEEGDQSRAVKDVLTLMTLMTGLPFQVAARPVAYAVDVAEGDIEPTDDLDYLRGLVTGSASQASR